MRKCRTLINQAIKYLGRATAADVENVQFNIDDAIKALREARKVCKD
jgi:hypothetical protein